METINQQHDLVFVEEMEQEEEEESLQRKKLSTINDDTSVDSETSIRIELEYPKKGVEEETRFHNGHTCVDSEVGNGNELEFPNKVLEQEGRLHDSVYFDQHNGIESVDRAFEMKNGNITCPTFGTNSGDADVNNMKNSETKESLITEMDYQCSENLDNKGFPGSSVTPIEESHEGQNIKAKSVSNETKLVGDFDSLEEIDQEETEFDVEGVLEKQNTHDLYCPNCNSCITRRVILRRKRKVRNARRKPKYNKLETTFSSELDADSTNSANVQVHETVDIQPNDSPAIASNNQNTDREPEVFRCLSCFNFFIPTGDGFKLFRLFGDRNDNENVQNLQKMPVTNRNWFLSIFKPDKKEMAVEEENETLANQNCLISSTASPSSGLVNYTGVASQQARQEILISSTGDNKHFEDVTTNVGEKSDTVTVEVNAAHAASNYSPMDTIEEANSQFYSDNVIDQHKKALSATTHLGISVTEETAEDASIGPLLVGVNFPVSSTFESLAPEQLPAETNENSRTATAEKQPLQNVQTSTVTGTQLPAKLSGTGALLNDSAVVHHESGTHATFSSSTNPILKEETTGTEEAAFSAIKKKDTGHDVMIVVETRPLDPAASQTETAQGNDASMEASSLLQSGTQMHTSEQRTAGITVDILKSIVYGGLIESITSLGVVSSAAGAGSATLNVLPLGLANLIGGLFIIGHNLIELKNDNSGGTANQMDEREDRYQETLGRRENFTLHAVVAIASFLIFGMLAPVIYGFSFRKSDDKDLKLAVVGGASLACILLLAIGKAHVRRPPKSYISTALYYVVLGVMASGISYVVGDIISKLMEKVGWFESSLAVAMIVPERKPVELAWASF